MNDKLNFAIGAGLGVGLAWGYWGLTPLAVICGFCVGGCILEMGCKILNSIFEKEISNF